MGCCNSYKLKTNTKKDKVVSNTTKVPIHVPVYGADKETKIHDVRIKVETLSAMEKGISQHSAVYHNN